MKRLENSFIYAGMKAVAFIAAAMFAFSACQQEEQKPEPKVEVSESEFTSEAGGNEFDVTVTSNVAWIAEIENQDKWVTVEPSEGEAGETKVTITVKRNNGDNPRDTKVTFKGETATAEVTVNQFGKDNISIDKKTYAVAPAGGTDAVKVTTNNNWTATVEEGADWVTVAPAAGEAGEATATVTVAKNEAAAARTAKVTFAAGEAKMEYTVSQEGVTVTLAQTSYAVEAAGGNTKVKVTANVDWTAAASADWVTVAPATGKSGETEVTVTVNENTVEEARTATVTFTANENVKVEFAVSQDAKKPIVLKNQYAFTAAGGEIIPVDIKSKFVTFVEGYAYAFLVPQEGINDMEAAMGCNEYVMCAVEESMLATVMANPSGEVNLKNVPEGAVQIFLMKGEDAPVYYSGFADEIKEGTITFSSTASEVVIDINMVMPNDSEFKANATFAPEAFVKPTGSVAIEVKSTTATKAELTFTPDPAEGFTYYFDILPKETADILMPTDQDVISYLVNDVNELLAQYGLTWADVIDEGVVNYTYTGASPLTSYYVVAFGIDGKGNVTTGLFRKEFTTKDIDPALKNWMGTWNVTSEKTSYSEKGGRDGIFDEPTTRTITIGTKSAGFGIELDETELIVAGLSYTDGLEFFGPGVKLETVGTVAQNGNLELKNGFVSFDATSAGMGEFTFLGYSWSEAMGRYVVVSGNYPPYTLTLGTDKTSGTGTPYSGELSNGADFTVVYYDMFSVDASGGISSYYSDPTYGGALAGKWTLTKVAETPAAAPKSADKKIMTKLEKKMQIQKNNLMKNLNSSYLFKSAQCR